jgi:hypothetical protein
VSIPAQGLGVNLTMQSYAGKLYLGITACKRALPNPAQLVDDLMATYQSMLRSVRRSTHMTLDPVVMAAGTGGPSPEPRQVA